MKSVIEAIEVFYKILDGGPVLCGRCIAAWRPSCSFCPACGNYLTGEQNTVRAREVYKLQRKDDAPPVGSSFWLDYLQKNDIDVEVKPENNSTLSGT